MPIPKKLSFSQLSLYNQCPHKYREKYILKKKEPGSIHTVSGSALHKLLQTVYAEKNFELSHWLTLWSPIFDSYCQKAKGFIISEQDHSKFLAQGYKSITTIYSWLQRQNLLRESLLQEWEFTSDYKKHQITGLADVVFEDGVGQLIVDYKFGRVISAEHPYQLFLYAAYYSRLKGISNLKGLLIYPQNIEKSRYILFTKELSQKAVQFFNGIYQRLTTDTEFRPTKNKYCSNCFLKKDGTCPLFKHEYVES